MTDAGPDHPATTPPEPSGLEEALEAVQAEAESALRRLGLAVKEAKKAKTAATLGKVRELQAALGAAVGLADQAATAVRDLRSSWSFDVAGWFASGEYQKELLARAAESGVQAFESDDRILSYPVIVTVSASDTSVVVDKRKERGVRPSVVASHLAALQARPPKFRSDQFIESLAAAYDLVVGSRKLQPGVPVRLVDVHRVLTLLPGSARDYTKQELARDLYLLDQSGKVETKDGRRMTLPASAMTRSTGVLNTVTRGGQAKVYAGIAFAGEDG